jgi:hypothetical protein
VLDPEDPSTDAAALLCVTCGRPITAGLYCHACVASGRAPCVGCEGCALEDLEEGE